MSFIVCITAEQCSSVGITASDNTGFVSAVAVCVCVFTLEALS
jgi:hypothetical protein